MKERRGKGKHGWRLLGQIPGPGSFMRPGAPSGPPGSSIDSPLEVSGKRAISFAAQGGKILLGLDSGVESWEQSSGGLLRARQRLEGRPVGAMAADADGQRIYLSQGASLWVARGGVFERLSRGPAGSWLHLWAHPRKPGSLIGSDGAGIFRSQDGGRRFVKLPPLTIGPIREARLMACPRGIGAQGALIARSPRTVWRGEAGRAGEIFSPGSPPIAVLEAAPGDPAVYVLAKRLFRWPCERQSQPQALEIGAEDVVAMGRDPIRPERIWLLGHLGLRAFEPRLGPALPRKVRLEPDPLASVCPFRMVSADSRGGMSAAWDRSAGSGGGASALGRARRAAWLPAVGLQLGGLARDGALHRLAAGGGPRRRLAQRLALFLTLRWPLEVPTLAILAEEAALAQSIIKSRKRVLGRQIYVCGPLRQGPLERWADASERAAVLTYHGRAEAARPVSRKGGAP